MFRSISTKVVAVLAIWGHTWIGEEVWQVFQLTLITCGQVFFDPTRASIWADFILGGTQVFQLAWITYVCNCARARIIWDTSKPYFRRNFSIDPKTIGFPLILEMYAKPIEVIKTSVGLENIRRSHYQLSTILGF